MEDKRITAEEILAEIDVDVKQMAQKVVDAINNAQAGAIIDQSEELVRDAHAEFRQRTYQKALGLLGKNQQAFSPRHSHPQVRWHNKGRQKTSCLTINGRMEFIRTVFWNKDHGEVVPMDRLLGIESSNHSHGVCEICCRESLNTAFVGAKSHQYVVGTSGNHEVTGRAMRRIGRQLDLSEARRKYSVTDGAPWILKQLNVQLPMLDDNVLDLYHLREHV